MIFPIKAWQTLKRGYLFGQKTFYNNGHIGLDVIAEKGTPIYAWQDLEVINSLVGNDGGNTIWIKCPNNKRLFRIMHLQFLVMKGKYKEGQIVAQVGDTGALCKGSHAHIDISKDGVLRLGGLSNFEDPELYFKTFVK